jgi:hypothetical protein
MRKFYLSLALGVAISIGACRDACDVIQCQNNGVCLDGACVCSDYFEGDFCEVYDPEGTKGTTNQSGETEGECAGHNNSNPYGK